jgi:hypothetical protein
VVPYWKKILISILPLEKAESKVGKKPSALLDSTVTLPINRAIKIKRMPSLPTGWLFKNKQVVCGRKFHVVKVTIV